jgi:hypothetical protein
MDDPAPAELPTIGWREWVAMPHLGIPAIKAKVDSGARSSSLHAMAVETFHRHGKQMVRFRVHPMQRDTTRTVVAEAELLGERQVRSSGGHVSLRPVIQTVVELRGESWNIELTLASRDTMGFRMLLGRQALRNRFLVHTGQSFLAGKRKKKKPRRRASRRGAP